MTQTDKMISRKDGAIGYLVFNNPERHNAVSLEMWERCAQIMHGFSSDPSIRVVVITGAGEKAFVSGADISKFAEERGSKEAAERYNKAIEEGYSSVYNCPKPTIAMIRGYCVGGGMGLASCCDIRICTENSKFSVPAAKLSVGYRYAGVKRLLDIVGPSFTKEIFFTARLFDAEEAKVMGFANRVLPGDQLEAYVNDYAITIAGNAPLTVDSIKFMVGEIVKDESARDMKTCDAMVAACFASNDYEEGRKAFMEKRKPVFTGS
ncbi:MAG: enoyl-CoA hydratase/isomerase family protein [Xanthobacteraceae bacterium]|nr:enoyl-CoA hydratase/isomerase family protein [Xanthobacteraceae bacterium]